MNPEYKPSEEEIKKAEEILQDNPELDRQTNLREQYHKQERAPFDDFLDLDDTSEQRREPTSEEHERLDRNLAQLSELFAGSGVRWNLDGAINISLVRGEYIGIHKDVDISVETEDIAKLDEALGRKGYGLFLSYPKDPAAERSMNTMERVGAGRFSHEHSNNLMIAAIDEQGKIQESGGPQLNFIDVHLIERDETGNARGFGGVEIPNIWAEKIRTEYQGHELYVSHPAKVAYYKLHGVRAYDMNDVRLLCEAGVLSLNDAKDLRAIMEREFQTRNAGVAKLCEQFSGEMKPGMDAGQIEHIFLNNPAVAARLEAEPKRRADFEQRFHEAAVTLAAAGDYTFETIKAAVFKHFNIEGSFDEMDGKLQKMEQWVGEFEAVKQARKEVQNS